MRIALDATYSAGGSLSGVGVYSREILRGLATAHPEVEWEWFYRSQRFWRAREFGIPAGVRRRFLADGWGSRSAGLFHGLNQRLPRRRFRRQIATFHDLFVLSGEYSTPEFRSRFEAQAREAADASDAIIAVSNFTARQVEEHLGIPQARIRVVHHGVLPRKLPDVAREKIVLCVGVIQRRKNQAILVSAFRALPEDWTLVLAGGQGFGAQETIEAIATSGCAGRIQMTGYVSDDELGAWYARAGIFAFPSLDEGFGIPLAEAMAAGIPVVTSNRSALPEVVGDAALLVDPYREDDLADALVRLALDPEIRERLAARGKLRAAAFTWEDAVSRTWNVYREVTS